MNKRYGTDSRHISWLYLFLGGFLIGILFMNIGKGWMIQDTELLNAASLSRLRYLKVDGNALFLYVLKERMGMVVILGLLATTYVGLFSLYVYSFFMGTMAGIFLSVASIRYGIKGVLLILMGILPQYFLLIPACIMLMNWCYQLCIGLYHPEKSYEIRCGNRKQYLIKKIPQLFVIVLIVIAGSLIESYVNPLLLSDFLKIF